MSFYNTIFAKHRRQNCFHFCKMCQTIARSCFDTLLKTTCAFCRKLATKQDLFITLKHVLIRELSSMDFLEQVPKMDTTRAFSSICFHVPFLYCRLLERPIPQVPNQKTRQLYTRAHWWYYLTQ
jgi:hypothetical protein